MIRPFQVAIQHESIHQNLADVVLLREALGVAGDDTAGTLALNFSINTASRMIENYVNQKLTERTVRLFYQTLLDNVLLIPVKPIHSYKVIDTTSNDDLPLGTLTYSGLLYLMDPPSQTTIEVDTGWHGAGDPQFDVPVDLQEAVIEIARTIYLRRSRSDEISSESLVGVVSTSYTNPRSIPFHIQDILDSHRMIAL